MQRTVFVLGTSGSRNWKVVEAPVSAGGSLHTHGMNKVHAGSFDILPAQEYEVRYGLTACAVEFLIRAFSSL
jgi:hypothetical protein